MTQPGFDPNTAARAGSGLFGLPHDPDRAAVHVVPVPWEVTTSYGGGTARAPAAVLAASHQVDLFDLHVDRPYEAGIAMLPADPRIAAWNAEARPLAERIIARGGAIDGDAGLDAARRLVNARSTELNTAVEEATVRILAAGRVPAILGGDHSAPYGAIRAAADRHPGLGMLQIDAHMDLRAAYEGFIWSHASIARNLVDRVPGIASLVQVGLRDFCEEEIEAVAAQGGRVQPWYDGTLARRRFQGETWGRMVAEIIAPLPKEVWISVDIDGLDPKLCPHTGTPVPGGLEFAEAVYLLAAVARSGRWIVGFDLVEVAPGPAAGGEWDANVGARLLYQLCAWTLVSQGRVRERR